MAARCVLVFHLSIPKYGQDFSSSLCSDLIHYRIDNRLPLIIEFGVYRNSRCHWTERLTTAHCVPPKSAGVPPPFHRRTVIDPFCQKFFSLLKIRDGRSPPNSRPFCCVHTGLRPVFVLKEASGTHSRQNWGRLTKCLQLIMLNIFPLNHILINLQFSTLNAVPWLVAVMLLLAIPQRRPICSLAWHRLMTSVYITHSPTACR